MVSLLELKRGTVVPVHDHENEQLSHCLSGLVRFTFPEGDLILHPGEVLLIPGRKFRADLFWPAHGVAVEVQGGIHQGGHHVRGHGYEDDCRKILYAAAEHVAILPITYEMLSRELEETAAALNKILDCREPGHRCRPGP